MDEKTLIVVIFGMAVVTYLPRVLPLIVLSGKQLPDWLISWLQLIPMAVLAAMLLPAILVHDGSVNAGIENLFFWASVPVFIAAILTKNLFISVLTGLLLVILGRMLLI